MKEWVTVSLERQREWKRLTDEAPGFVGSSA